MITVPGLLRTRAHDNPRAPFLQELDGRTQSIGDFYEDVLRWADVLIWLGVGRTDSVATMLANSARSFHCYVASSLAGGIEVPVNDGLRGATLLHALNTSRARILIVERALAPVVLEVAEGLTWLNRIVLVGPGEPIRTPPAHVAILEADELLAGAATRERRIPDPSDPAAVIFTSGTTGSAKGVVKPWGDMLQFSRDWWIGVDEANAEGGGYLQVWPVYHMSGKTALSLSLDAGLRMVIRRKFSVSRFWADVRDGAVTHCAFIFVLPLVMQVAATPDDANNPLRVASICPLSADFANFQRRFDVPTVLTGWGMTEAGQPLGTDVPTNGQTCGHPLNGAEVRLVDENGKSVADGVHGELLVRSSPGRANGAYLGMPDASAQVWRDGWVHTGDVFIRDAQGEYYFVDRKKDSLRRRGENISSLEVEREVLAHPAVIECACVGVPSNFAQHREANICPLGDEDVKVFVRLAGHASLTAAELANFLERRMPAHMRPRFIEFVDDLPKTPTGKVRKADLRSLPNDGVWDREAARRPRRNAGDPGP